MSTDKVKNAADRGSEFSAGLGPLLAEADMEALAAVAEQAGLQGIDLHALARVLDAAQRIAAAEERERWQRIAANAQAVTNGSADKTDHFEVPSHLMAALALALDEGLTCRVSCPRASVGELERQVGLAVPKRDNRRK